MALSSAASLLAAIIIVRVPEFWQLLPEFAFRVAESYANPSTQEVAANIEFMVVWVLCFFATALVALAICTAVSLRRGGRSGSGV